MINGFYLKKEVQASVLDVLEKEGSVQLFNFLDGLEVSSNLKKEYDPLSHKYSVVDFSEKAFLDFFSSLFGEGFSLVSSKVFSFSHGDYSLLEDDVFEEEGYCLIFDFCDFDELFGGYHSFVKDSEEVVRLLPKKYCLSIVKTSKDMQSFVKYVNHFAGEKKRMFLLMGFVVSSE